MKRIIVVLLLVCLTAGFVFSQNLDEKVFSEAMGGFAKSMATALPFNTSIGLSWSDAYIGQLLAVPPHFGFGVTVGATFIPMKGVEKLITDLGSTLPTELKDLAAVGIPIPGAVVDARIGGFFLPFDIGLKGLVVDRSLLHSVGVPKDVKVDLTNLGADFRYALVEQNILLPNISVGLGVNYVKGLVGMPSNIASEKINFPGYVVSFEPGDVALKWDATSVELKAQISKNLLIITPYIGGGVSMNWSSIGGGLEAAVKINGVPATDAEIQALKDKLKSLNITVPDITSKGLNYVFPVSGLGARVFGGFSLNILVIKLDATAMYNIIDGALGASLGIRFQL